MQVDTLVFAENKIQKLSHISNRSTQLEIIALKEEFDNLVWRNVERNCKLLRRVPEPPESFIPALKTKHFGHMSDVALLEHLYLQAYFKCVHSTPQFLFDELRWHDAEAISLAGILAHCRELQKLDLSKNFIGDAGAVALAGVLPSLIELTHFSFEDNRVSERGAASLAVALPLCARLHQVALAGNPLGDVGRAMLNEVELVHPRLHIYVHHPEGKRTKVVVLEAKTPQELARVRQRHLLIKYNMKRKVADFADPTEVLS